jgi:hypothetical protein
MKSKLKSMVDMEEMMRVHGVKKEPIIASPVADGEPITVTTPLPREEAPAANRKLTLTREYCKRCGGQRKFVNGVCAICDHAVLA